MSETAGEKVARDVTIWIVSSRGMESLGWAEETGNKTKLGPNEKLVVLVADYNDLLTQRDALEAREKVLREALKLAEPFVAANCDGGESHKATLSKIRALLALGAPKP